MGFNKTPTEHGAIPIEPYSHTPGNAGAQQPGMTGLVKEELLVRPAELGAVVSNGALTFDPRFLATSELLGGPQQWPVFDTPLAWTNVELPANSVGSTVCQVPIVVAVSDAHGHVEAELADGEVLRLDGDSLGPELSSEVFKRTGYLAAIRAFVPSPG
jgi:hypothetical protein